MNAEERKRGLRAAVNAKAQAYGDLGRWTYTVGLLWEIIDSLVDEVEGMTLEVCTCAAVRLRDGTIIRGYRHGDCLRKVSDIGLSRIGSQQGFYTSAGRFVCRKEGFLLQHKAGIASAAEGGYRGKELFSEDLY